MDEPPNRKRPVSLKGFWVLIGLSLFFTAKAELYCTFEILPIENKIYVRDDSRVSWPVRVFYPRYVRINRTEVWKCTHADIMNPNFGKNYDNKLIFYEDADDPWIEHQTYWEDFNEKYNDF